MGTATYEIAAPDGSKYHITGPDDADPSSIIAQVQQEHAASSTSAPQSSGILDKLSGLAHDIWTGIGGNAANAPAQAVPSTPDQLAQMREEESFGGASPAVRAASSQALAHAATGVAGGLAGTAAGLGRYLGGGLPGLPLATSPQAASNLQQTISKALTYQPTNPNALPAAQSFDRAAGLVPAAIQRYVANPAKSVLPASAGPTVDYLSQFSPALIDPALRGVGGVAKAAGRTTPALADYAARVGETPALPPLPPRPGAAPAAGAAPAGTAASGFGADTASAARTPPIGPQNPQALNDAMAAAARGRNGENQPNNGLNNATAVDRHLRAASLPVPVNLTEAAATGDPTVFTLQKELQSQAARAGDTRLVDRVVENNNQLVGNLRALRSGAQAEGTGSEVTVPASDADKGDTLMQLAQNRAATVKTATTAAYDALRAEANRLGPDTKVYDATGPLQQAQALLTTNLRRKVTENTPALSGLMQDLHDAADGGGFTADAYLTTRRDAMNLARTASDGWVRQAAGNITQALDNADLMPGAENLRTLDQQARGMFRQERQIEEADPLYAAATSGDPAMTGQKFMNRFITGTAATRDGITRFLQTLGDDTPARQIVATSFADALRDAAKVTPDGRGVFRQASYNAQLKKLSDRIQAVSPNMGNLAQAIGDTARDVGEFPPGEVSSKSNSSDWLRGMLMDHATNLIPGGALVKGAVQLGKGLIDRGKMTRSVDRAVAPYAGLGRTDLAQPAIPTAESVPDFFPRQTAAAAAQPPPPRGAPTPQPSPNRPGGGSPGSVPPPPRPGPAPSNGPPPPPPSSAPRARASGAANLPPLPPRTATPQSAPTMPPRVFADTDPHRPMPEGYQLGQMTPDVSGMTRQQRNAAVNAHAQQLLDQHGMQQARDMASLESTYAGGQGQRAFREGDAATQKQAQRNESYWTAVYGRLTSLRDRQEARGAATPDLRSIGQAITRETGSGTVDIAELQKRTGLPLPQVHQMLQQEIDAGRAVPTRDTSRGAGSKERAAAALHINGQPYVSVTFK